MMINVMPFTFGQFVFIWTFTYNTANGRTPTLMIWRCKYCHPNTTRFPGESSALALSFSECIPLGILLRNSSHTLGMHPAVLVRLILVLELIYTITVCLKMIIMWFACDLCSRECVMDLLSRGDPQVCLQHSPSSGQSTRHRSWSWNALPVRQGWLASIKPTNTACENDMQRRHKHFQGILTAGSPRFHDL